MADAAPLTAQPRSAGDGLRPRATLPRVGGERRLRRATADGGLWNQWLRSSDPPANIEDGTRRRVRDRRGERSDGLPLVREVFGYYCRRVTDPRPADGSGHGRPSLAGRRLLARRRVPSRRALAGRGARGDPRRDRGVGPQLLLLRRRRAGPRGGGHGRRVAARSAACPPAIKELEPVEGWPWTEASLVFKDRIADLHVAPRRSGCSSGAAWCPSARPRPASSAGSTSASPRSTASPTTRGATAAPSAARRAARPRRWPAGSSAWPPAATAAARSASPPATPACSA